MQKGDTHHHDILIAVAGEPHLMAGASGETAIRTKMAG
jgi:hypothetical protein